MELIPLDHCKVYMQLYMDQDVAKGLFTDMQQEY